MRLRPEIMTALVRFWRDRVQVAHLDATRQFAFGGKRAGFFLWCAFTGVQRPHVQTDKARRREIDELPAIDIAFEAAGLDVGGRRRRVKNPARNRHVMLGAQRLDLGLFGRRIIAYGRLVHKRKMAEVEQVFDNQLVTALDVINRPLRAPLRVIHPVEIGYFRLVRERRVAHPHPDPAMAFGHRITSDTRRLRNRLLPRNTHALAAAIVGEAVVVTLEAIVDHAALVQGIVPVAAPVFECRNAAVTLAVKNQRLVENHPSKRFICGDFMVPGGDIPGIAQKHRLLQSGRCAGNARQPAMAH